jgi:hypothetical protein
MRPAPVEVFELPLSQYGSNIGISDLQLPTQPQSSDEAGEDSLSVGLEVAPPSSPRSPGMVCYTRSPGSTPSSPVGPATPAPDCVVPGPAIIDSPGTGTTPRAPRRPRQPAQPSRHSSRLTQARVGAEGLAPTVPEQAARRAAARNLEPGTSHDSFSPSPPPIVSPPTGSRFSVLGSVPLDHLDQVASDCRIIFRGERGPRREQIAAIKAKEIFEGALAASRAQAEHERAAAPEPTGPVQLASGPSMGPSPLPRREASPTVIPQAGGIQGRPPKPPSRPWTRSRARSVPNRGTPPDDVPQ